ncbi:M28 family peptidase [archaeon]|nr:M28 family peptidase [archaeon]
MKLLEELMNAYGVSGREENVRKIIVKHIRPFVDELYIDKIGNLIARKKGKGHKVMLAAHMDEIGMIVKNIDAAGKIWIATIGGLEPIVVIGQRVFIAAKKKRIYGVISTREITHDIKVKEVPKQEDLFIETGMKKEELARDGVEVGSYVSLLQPIMWLGKHRISGKALDDRIGCYILIQLAKKLKKSKNEVYFVFTVQEEIGLYGARTSAYEIEPDWAVVVDVTNTDNGLKGSEKHIGKGPTVTVKDADFIANKHLNEKLEEIAKKKKIPIQWDIAEVGTTEAISILISKTGVAATVVGVAVKNLHSPVVIAYKKDIEQAIELIEGLLQNPPALEKL